MEIPEINPNFVTKVNSISTKPSIQHREEYSFFSMFDSKSPYSVLSD